MIKHIAVAAALAVTVHGAVTAQAPPVRKADRAQSRFSIDTPIVQLLANPKSRAAFARHMPTVVASPHLKQFQHLSIRQLAANPHASLAASKIRALQADLARIK